MNEGGSHSHDLASGSNTTVTHGFVFEITSVTKLVSGQNLVRSKSQPAAISNDEEFIVGV